MGLKKEWAWVYKLEDINDNEYVGTTSELNPQSRLHTHRRDMKESLLKIKTRSCSSMKLDLYHCILIPLKRIKNDKETRSFWERHYINNVYPNCVNTFRLNSKLEKRPYDKEYYHKNSEKIIQRTKSYRINNREKYNSQRRKYYSLNKEKIKNRRSINREMKRLENI
tara:strand:- start:200 stop:700 length:501 start_codon:yes stop_codon:yes gene_type:complete